MPIQLLAQVLWALTIVTACYVVERLRPSEEDPGVAPRLENLLLFVLNGVVLVALLGFLADPLARLPSLGLLGRIEALAWLPAVVRTITVVILYALVWDFFQYWVHRAHHRFDFLWRFHRTHHDDLAMTSATADRQSIGGSVIGVIGIHVPTVCVLGYQGLPLVANVILFAGWGYYNHANVRGGLPRLEGFISGPSVHRLHHVHATHLRGRNLAAFFTFYDRLFGTFARPVPGERVSTHYPLTVPFGFRRVVRSWLSLGSDD